MIPGGISAVAHTGSIPRESGDDPLVIAAAARGRWYSPRERG